MRASLLIGLIAALAGCASESPRAAPSPAAPLSLEQSSDGSYGACRPGCPARTVKSPGAAPRAHASSAPLSGNVAAEVLRETTSR
jgi:hypothetical protein